MKILITGGAGYIGSVIVQLMLERGYRVNAIDTLWFRKDVPLVNYSNPNYRFIKGNICDKKLLDSLLKEGFDYIIHTAAIVGDPASTKYPELTYEVNYKASLELISKALQYGVKGFIFFSTCSNYGISEGMATENTALNPLSLYAKTKVDVEKYLMNEARMDWVICRLSTAYGTSPRMRFDLTVNDFSMHAYIKKYLKVFLPYSYRPYVHVYDIASVVVEIIKNFDRLKNNVFNLGFEGQNYQKLQIAEIVKGLIPDIDIDVDIKIAKKGVDLRDYQVDFSKLKRYLGINNRYNVREGVKEIVELLDKGIIKNPEDSLYYNTSLEEERREIEDRVGCP